jgi:3-isopropylmalate dehydratase small subunit
MVPFTTVTGIAAPLLRDDINTDEITPIHRAHPRARLCRAAVHAHPPARRRQSGPRFRFQQAAVPPGPLSW